MPSVKVSTERALIVSSDGHAVGQMADYRPYVESKYLPQFDDFCKVYEREGLRTTEPTSLRKRIDEDLVQEWIKAVVDTGRLEGQGDPHKRLLQLDREGVAAEVLFPDFGMPFELHPPLVAATLGYERDPELIEQGNKTYNRWLADFCKTAPARFTGLAVVSFADVDDTVAEIRRAKESGLSGIVLPAVDEHRPFFHNNFEPIWDVLEELEMPANAHTAITSITKHLPTSILQAAPHPAVAATLLGAHVTYCSQQVLPHFIWGGVLERHPNLQLVLTESGSGWVVGALAQLDYTWEYSYLRRDVREIVPSKPSEYFRRQVHLGSSLFSLAEAKARNEIGVDKLAIGTDYPHHEGTWGVGPGTSAWLRATLGAAGVPVEDARKILSENAVRLWHLDQAQLRAVADRIGPSFDEILTPPGEDHYPRGDVHKPLVTA